MYRGIFRAKAREVHQYSWQTSASNSRTAPHSHRPQAHHFMVRFRLVGKVAASLALTTTGAQSETPTQPMLGRRPLRVPGPLPAIGGQLLFRP